MKTETSTPRREWGTRGARASSKGEALQNVREDEWDLGEALKRALECMPLWPGPARDKHLARLGPLVEGALGELEHLQRERDLSDGELARKEALEGLLVATRADGPNG